MQEELPIACDMTALNAAQRERQQALMKSFHASIQETLALDDGYAFRLAANTEMILLAAEFITIERLCCPFFNFEMEVGPPGAPLWLRISGREGVKEFIKMELGIG
jgi:hypothetical protein